MHSKPKLKERIAYALGRLRGIPIETDLDRFEALAAEAIAAGHGSLAAGELRGRALALRGEFGAAAGRRALRAATLSGLSLAAEACRRQLRLEPFRGQLIAAAALCDGSAVQMPTGEGKTLAAALAACVAAMRDGGVHVITANDYLARRDEAWMRPIFEALGLSSASVSGGDPRSSRRAAYSADILYVTARELGFDYLRDGLALEAGDLVQRDFRSAIVDEADFILIDEARVPLVIAAEPATSGEAQAPESAAAAEVAAADRAARSLEPGEDYRVDAEGRKLWLTLAGRNRLESLVGGGIHEAESAPRFARVQAALTARCLLRRDVDYLVKDGAVRLIDAFTGRVAEDRRWPWGVQAALEEKEGLEPMAEGRIFGSIAVQHLMGLFPRIAAMTATAVPAAAEFAEAYGMPTVLVPPAKPSMRRDEPDLVFWDRGSRSQAIVDEAAREHRRGRPILVGTASVRESEELALAMRAEGIPCVVLNARNDKAEASLVAAAGGRGAVTISTDMAGRGTDIRLGPGARELGGLCVLGSARRDSRRMDDQLRGRAGRQGDPGSSRFFVSLEDELFERHGVRDFLPPRYRSRGPGDTGPIEDPAAAREISRAQALLEGLNARRRLALRKYSLLVEYDRRFVRALRDDALADGSLPLPVEEALAGKVAAPEERAAMATAFLHRIDSAWAAHLELVEDIKEGLGLFLYGKRDPGAEFVALAAGAFEAAMRDLEWGAAEDCLAILEGRPPAKSDRPPDSSEAWTYSVEEEPAAGFFESLFRAR
jgi:preprotein translocase subunit SecA